MGKIVVLFTTVESEFKNLHSRIACLLHKLGYIGSECSEVFGNNINLAECLFHHIKELNARTYNPFTVDCVFGRIRN